MTRAQSQAAAEASASSRAEKAATANFFLTAADMAEDAPGEPHKADAQRKKEMRI